MLNGWPQWFRQSQMAILVGYIGKRQPCRKAELTKCINQMYNLRNKINDKDASAQHRAVSDRMITDLDNVQFAQ